MSFTFDPYRARSEDVSVAEDILMTNPTALQELEIYWRSLPRSRGIPKRTDVDPTAMGTLLEDSFILERVAPGVARIRVAGRNIGQLAGTELRGMPMSAIFVPASRIAMSNFLENAFDGPNIVEIPLEAPRAMGQPKLDGKLLMLPLRDDFGRVNRLLGVLVMSGRRGIGPRRFQITENTRPRIERVNGLQAVETLPYAHSNSQISVPLASEKRKAKDRPALRLVVSNP